VGFVRQVAALPKGAKVEIEAVAVVGEIVEETLKE
jgi:enamine deaminase RidA (YjgF/YER057c/UK114 family)